MSLFLFCFYYSQFEKKEKISSHRVSTSPPRKHTQESMIKIHKPQIGLGIIPINILP